MKLAGRKVLVTGASGFIGSHLIQGLLGAGADVRAFIKYNSMNHRGFLDTLSDSEQRAIEVVKGDLRDLHAVQNAVKGTSVVFHLGALIAIPYSYQSPTDVIHTNVEGTLNVALASRDADVDCMIHTSTSEVYGTARFVPMDESHPLQGQSPYSASKIAADKIVESFYCSYKLPVKTVRPFNAFGPRQSMRAVIPTIINQVLYQEEIALGNVTSTRDFTFVTDTSRAFMAAASAGGGFGEVFNAGSGFEMSIEELATRVMALVGRNLPIRTAKERLRTPRSEVERLYSDSQKADRVLGWKPIVSLEEGLTKTITWIEQHRSLYRPDEYVL